MKKENEQGLSALKAGLLDQYIRISDNVNTYLNMIRTDCVKGSVSVKTIKGKKYYYLQWKENGKPVSKYIQPEHLAILQANINLRKRYETIIKELKRSQKEIEQFVGKEKIRKYFNGKRTECKDKTDIIG